MRLRRGLTRNGMIGVDDMTIKHYILVWRLEYRDQRWDVGPFQAAWRATKWIAS